MIQQPLKVYNESNAEFESLLNEDLSQRSIQENTIIKGRVEKIEDKFITIDVKGKSSGMIDKSELSREELDNLKVDGGASNNNLLMQIQSNFLQANVIRPKITETTALGVAFFAGLASGFWESIDEIKSVWEVEKQFSPQKNKNDLLVIYNWEERIKKVL